MDVDCELQIHLHFALTLTLPSQPWYALPTLSECTAQLMPRLLGGLITSWNSASSATVSA